MGGVRSGVQHGDPDPCTSASGPISGIIAGMEWAARTGHVKVINMSLGTPAWHTQNDPLSQAVNHLSAETDALFVIAAGNSGNNRRRGGRLRPVRGVLQRRTADERRFPQA
ncbi:S8 family serine peptidase [Streptomyces sp. NPDC008061]|uniref:S8 family serine peptidase n=1 Tax=Streptomyces sp. NPDC008061 TaxID=3364805 RepID=UPI0036E11926